MIAPNGARNVTAVFACVALVAACARPGGVRRPWIRTHGYHEAIAAFERATDIPSTEAGQGVPVWRANLSTRASGEVTVTGRAFMDVLKVQYADEHEPRLIVPPEDYPTTLDARSDGSALYVYRAVTVVWTEYRLAVYDLEKRQLRNDWLVDPDDVPLPDSP